MAFGACDHCNRYYLLDHEQDAENRCQNCAEPLRRTTFAEVIAHLRRLSRREDTCVAGARE